MLSLQDIIQYKALTIAQHLAHIYSEEEPLPLRTIEPHIECH